MTVVLERVEPLEVLLEVAVVVPHHVPQLVAHALVGARVRGVRRAVRVRDVGAVRSESARGGARGILFLKKWW